jgi:hypothetical protein
MKKEEQLTRKIEDLRTGLETIIEEEKVLINPEVIKASQSLDEVLIQYYNMLGIRRLRILKEGAK